MNRSGRNFGGASKDIADLLRRVRKAGCLVEKSSRNNGHWVVITPNGSRVIVGNSPGRNGARSAKSDLARAGVIL